MIFLKLFIMTICALLNLIGGNFFLAARRFIMPCVLGFGISLFSHCWWLGFTTLPLMGILCLGYGEKSLFYKYFTDAGARGMWLFLCAVVIGLGLIITGHIAYYIYIPYCIIAGILGATLRNINEIIGDLIFGFYLSSIIIFMR